MSTHTRRTTLRAPAPFDLRLVVGGHGWAWLPPHVWDDERRTFATVLGAGRCMTDVLVRQAGARLVLEVTSRRRLEDRELAEVRHAVARMLRLDLDLTTFWRRCRAVPRLAWVARRGAGRLMRSANLFEDLLKLLLTTNCSWAATTRMVQALVQALGRRAPSGRRGFPTARACAVRDETFWRETVRAGYRAPHCVALSRAFATGSIDAVALEDPRRPEHEVYEALTALPGFGPYAAGQAMRLLGRHRELALDSWCRARLAQLAGRPPGDHEVERAYRAFGEHAGLALWMDLTASWHGEPEPSNVLAPATMRASSPSARRSSSIDPS